MLTSNKHVRDWLELTRRSQAVDATPSAKTSSGVRHPKVRRGRRGNSSLVLTGHLKQGGSPSTLGPDPGESPGPDRSRALNNRTHLPILQGTELEG